MWLLLKYIVGAVYGYLDPCVNTGVPGRAIALYSSHLLVATIKNKKQKTYYLLRGYGDR